MDDSQDLVLFGGVIPQVRGQVAFPGGAIPLSGSDVAPVSCCYRLRNDVPTRLEGGFAIVGGELAFGNSKVALVDEALPRLGCPLVFGQVQRYLRTRAGPCRAYATASRSHLVDHLNCQCSRMLAVGYGQARTATGRRAIVLLMPPPVPGGCQRCWR